MGERRFYSIGKALEHNAVHSQCRRISYKRKGDDAPLVFGIRLADIRSGERAETAAIGARSGVIEKVSNIRKVRGTMDRSDAIRKVNAHLGERLLKGSGRNSNTHFSNINKSAKQVWWFNIPPQRFENELHILLAKKQGLIWLRIKAGTIPHPESVFRVRPDKGSIHLEMPVSGDRYLRDIMDRTGYDFRPHIAYEWDGD